MKKISIFIIILLLLNLFLICCFWFFINKKIDNLEFRISEIQNNNEDMISDFWGEMLYNFKKFKLK